MHFKAHFKSLLLKTTLGLLAVGSQCHVFAKEGMWMPPLLKQKEGDMKAMGLQIPIEQIYNTDGSGLNNAVVLFGSGCTGEIISSKGLLLTNHHCGYGTVQGLSSTENDYFAKGFWAMNNGEELPCPGLTVTFIRKMENVTDKITFDIPDTLAEASRDSIISVRTKNLAKGYKYTSGYDATIKPYYSGNQYWVILTETFRDIRLVGFPPNGIGTFGGDTDNWMWPRHTGDFSMFRVYSSKDNKPADYSKDNKPYTPNRFFSINVSGYKEGDFTMVYGFPGYTQEYISSYELDNIYSITDPVRIEVRTKLLDTWAKHMNSSRETFLKYTSKHKRVANGWKKWQGEVRGLKINDVVNKKATYEQQFQGWSSQNVDLPYANDLLPKMGAISLAVTDQLRASRYIQEAIFGIELVKQGAQLNKLLDIYRSGLSGQALIDTLTTVANSWNGFYKNYDATTDKDVFGVLMPMFVENNSGYVPTYYTNELAKYRNNYDQWADNIYKYSIVPNKNKLSALASSGSAADSTIVLNDPAFKLYMAIMAEYDLKVRPALNNYNTQMDYYNRLYMNAQMKLDKFKSFYPDANLTLRLTYGKVDGINPDGPAEYSFQTNLDEAVAKHNPNEEEFDMPEKLRELHKNKNYGRWGVNGTVPTCFIASNHTTGGNSGSPVLNAKGQLIGTNFDRIWEGTMSDLHFDPNLCRNISLDIRYTLFIVDKFGGASWLLNEMDLVTK